MTSALIVELIKNNDKVYAHLAIKLCNIDSLLVFIFFYV